MRRSPFGRGLAEDTRGLERMRSVSNAVRSVGLAAVTIKQPFVTMEFRVAVCAAGMGA